MRVAAYDSRGNRKIQPFEVRYLPRGRSNVNVPQASFLASEPEARRPHDERIRIAGVRLMADLKGRPGPPVPKLFDESRAIPAGTWVVIDLEMPEPEPGAIVALELAQIGTSGYFSLPVDTSAPKTCAGGVCRFQVELTMQHDVSEEKPGRGGRSSKAPFEPLDLALRGLLPRADREGGGSELVDHRNLAELPCGATIGTDTGRSLA
jgi:hypothetical protein